MELTNLEITTILTIVLCMCITIYLIYLHKQLAKKTKYHDQLSCALDAVNLENAKLKEMTKQFSDFHADMHMADVTTKLQQTRLSAAHNTDRSQPPEKYQYVHSLTQKGINCEDIASILSMSHQEADQLVKLANLSIR